MQHDGTIIREYVIDDPSMLEQLSDGEENNESNSGCYQIQKRKNSIDKTVINSNYQQSNYSKDLANEYKIKIKKVINIIHKRLIIIEIII